MMSQQRCITATDQLSLKTVDPRYNDMVRQRQNYHHIEKYVYNEHWPRETFKCCRQRWRQLWQQCWVIYCALCLKKSVILLCFLQAVASATLIFHHSEAVMDKEREVALLVEWQDLECLQALLDLNLGHDCALRCSKWKSDAWAEYKCFLFSLFVGRSDHDWSKTTQNIVISCISVLFISLHREISLRKHLVSTENIVSSKIILASNIVIKRITIRQCPWYNFLELLVTDNRIKSLENVKVDEHNDTTSWVIASLKWADAKLLVLFSTVYLARRSCFCYETSKSADDDWGQEGSLA